MRFPECQAGWAMEPEANEAANGRPTIYDVAGVSPSTVSRALAKPGRVSFRTAEHVRKVAEELGYRSGRMDLPCPRVAPGLALIVADIADPVLVMYVIFQRQLQNSVTAGSLK